AEQPADGERERAPNEAVNRVGEERCHESVDQCRHDQSSFFTSRSSCRIIATIFSTSPVRASAGSSAWAPVNRGCPTNSAPSRLAKRDRSTLCLATRAL